MNRLIFNGVVLNDYCDYIFLKNTEPTPERVYEEVEVPGRNGNILIDQKHFLNTERQYVVIFTEGNVRQRFENFMSVLNSNVDYCLLEDSMFPDIYFVAKVNPIEDYEFTKDGLKAKAELSFSRKPQKYLKSGQEFVEVGNEESIFNPTLYESQPVIRIYGSGTVSLNSETITVSTERSYVDVDCELMTCYCGEYLENNSVSFSANDFPVLSKGETTVTYSGVTKVEIMPRWWKI